MNYTRIIYIGAASSPQPEPARHIHIEPDTGPHPPARALEEKFCFWWRGKDYSTPAAFRPPGRCAMRSVLRRSRASVKPLVGSHPPPPKALEEKFCFWWRGEDSNLRRLSRQIYSLIPLTAREPLQKRGGILWERDFAVNYGPRL